MPDVCSLRSLQGSIRVHSVSPITGFARLCTSQFFSTLRSDLPRRAVSEVFLFFSACNLIKAVNLQMDLSEPGHVEQRYYAFRPHTADAVSLFEVGVLDRNAFLAIK